MVVVERDECSVISKGGILDSLGQRFRKNMHEQFIHLVKPQPNETILDVGACANPAFSSSNYLESASPELNITALGLGFDNPVWQKCYPSVPYLHGTALELPFEDKSFDIVYSHAVIEHVGHFDNQVKMLREAQRVARKSVWITTPNRWHPVEVHTVLPLLHWLPKHVHRFLLHHLGRKYFATEEVLNLLDMKSLNEAVKITALNQNIQSKVHTTRLCGFTANLLLHIKFLEF